ncbi:MAG TPA: hypothetical protein VID50_03755 [Candidatus Eisenbacteria bacterium]|jgi:hypothetical protein
MRPRPVAIQLAAPLVIAALAATPLPGSSMELGWSATYASWYSFQGLDYSDRRPVLQPELECTLRGISLGLWGSFDQSREELNEADITLQWDWERGRLSGGLGYTNLQYPHRPDWRPSQEILADFAFDAMVAPSLSLHWDLDEGRGRYWALGIDHGLPGMPRAVRVAERIYAQEDYYGMSGISAGETRVSVRGPWAGVVWEPALARVWCWENADFRGTDAVLPGWLLRVTLSPR